MPLAPLSLACLLLCQTPADPAARWRAVQAQSGRGAAALPAALRALAEGDAAAREAAATVLGRLGAQAAPAAPALGRALLDPEPLVRERAAQALGLAGAGAGPGIPALAGLLGDPDLYVQGQAVVALGRLGPAALPVLRAALAAPEPVRRRNAAAALGRAGAAAAVPALAKALADPDAGVRYAAGIALGEAGTAARTAAPAVRLALADADEDVRWAAAWALERLGAEPGPGLEATLAELTPALMKELHVPGVSIAVIRDRKLAWSGAFGVLEAPAGKAVDPETIFEACSMSKPVFTYLVLAAVDQGLLDLDRPLAGYLKEITLPSQDERNLITARMVLDHTSGLPNWRRDGEETEGPVPVKFPPGSRFSYSGEGMFYLQRVLEHIMDEPLDLAARRLVFQPLGMASSSYVWTPALAPRQATGHKTGGQPNPRTRYQHGNAAYTLYTTPGDYARFLQAFLDPARGTLAPATLKACLTPQILLDAREPMERPGAARGSGAGWCLGWSVNFSPAGAIYHHSGSNQSGFKCFSQFDPARGTGLVIMTNSSGGGELWSRLVNRVGDM